MKKQNPLRFVLLLLTLLRLYRDWSEILLLRSDDRQIHISFSHSSAALCIFYSHQGPWAKAQQWGPVMTPSFVPWLKPHRVLLHSAGSHEAFPSSHQEAWEPADRSTRQPRQLLGQDNNKPLAHYSTKHSCLDQPNLTARASLHLFQGCPMTAINPNLQPKPTVWLRVFNGQISSNVFPSVLELCFTLIYYHTGRKIWHFFLKYSRTLRLNNAFDLI